MKAAYYRVDPKTNNEWAWVCSYRMLLFATVGGSVDAVGPSPHNFLPHGELRAITFVIFHTFATVRRDIFTCVQ